MKRIGPAEPLGFKAPFQNSKSHFGINIILCGVPASQRTGTMVKSQYRKQNQIFAPSRALFAFDFYSDNLGLSQFWLANFNQRHGADYPINAVFLDGHAETHVFNYWISLRPEPGNSDKYFQNMLWNGMKLGT